MTNKETGGYVRFGDDYREEKDKIVKELMALLKKNNLIEIIGNTKEDLEKKLKNMSYPELFTTDHKYREKILIIVQMLGNYHIYQEHYLTPEYHGIKANYK